MRDAPALIATVDQVAGVATVTVRGEFEPFAYSRLRDRLRWVAENCPRRLVLDLGPADGLTEQLITLIAAARQQLPAGCLLEVRAASPAVRNLVEVAGWPDVQVTGTGVRAELEAAALRPDGAADPSGDGDVADITELVLAGYQRVLLLWQALLDARRSGGDWGSARAVATVWDRLADMLDLHAAAQEEICYPFMFETSPQAVAQMEDAAADLDRIREAVAEARLHRVGSRSWWRAVEAALSARVAYFDHREEGILVDFCSRADSSARQRLGGEWSVFIAARIRDLDPSGQAEDAACQLCQWPLPASHGHALDTEGCAVLCACDCCYELYRWAARDEPSGARGSRAE